MNRETYVIGGENESGELENAVEVINFESATTRYEVTSDMVDNLPSGRSRCSSIVYNSTIWIIGK